MMTSERERERKTQHQLLMKPWPCVTRKQGLLLFVVYVVTSLAYPSGLERETRKAGEELDNRERGKE